MGKTACMHIYLVKCTPRNCRLTTYDIYARAGVSRQMILAVYTHNLERLDLHLNLKSGIGTLRAKKKPIHTNAISNHRQRACCQKCSLSAQVLLASFVALFEQRSPTPKKLLWIAVHSSASSTPHKQVWEVRQPVVAHFQYFLKSHPSIILDKPSMLVVCKACKNSSTFIREKTANLRV